MRIAWVSPFSSQSSIGRRSEEIVGELSKVCDVDLWHPQTEDERPTAVPRRRFVRASDVDPAELARYDMVAYNMGNYLPFHGEIYKLAVGTPGVVVLHDLVLHHFFAAYYFEELRQPTGYRDAMARLYGHRGKKLAEGIIAGSQPRVWERDEVVDFPMFEDALTGAYGVIAHSDFLVERVRKVFAGPVQKIPLCCELSSADSGTRGDLDVPAGRPLIVTVGHVNPNKRIDSVLRALAAVERPFSYVIAGPFDGPYQRRLQGIVDDNGLNKSVTFLGYVSDNLLHAYLRHADLCINLRYPAFEGSSGSIVEEMWHGKATIVTNTGFYRELPDDTVHKISHENEIAELTAAIRLFLGDPEERHRLGQRALAHARTQFHPAQYAHRVLEFATRAIQTKAAIRLADRIGSELRNMGVTSEMPEAASISDRAYDLFLPTSPAP